MPPQFTEPAKAGFFVWGAAMRLTAKTDVTQPERDLDSFIDRVRRVAVPRALNELAPAAQTAGFRKINAIYQIGPSVMAGYATIKLADAGDFEASINVRGKGFPLSVFAPLQTKAGVTVRVKGKRVLIPGAFLATMANGHRGVFARGAYGGKGVRVPSGKSFGRFRFGYSKRITKPRTARTELSINELYTFAPPDAFDNEQVVEAMNDRVAELAPAQLRRQIAAVRRGF